MHGVKKEGHVALFFVPAILVSEAKNRLFGAILAAKATINQTLIKNISLFHQ
jgi:hypothetical protein